jgi:hypothetical protein
MKYIKGEIDNLECNFKKKKDIDKVFDVINEEQMESSS